MKCWRLYKSSLEKYSTARILTRLLIVTWLVYGYMLAYSIPELVGRAAGFQILDMRPLGYSYEFVQDLLNTLGPEGRHFYLTHQIPVDMLYPILFALSYSSLLYFLFRKIDAVKKIAPYLSLVPVCAGLFDYFENAGVILLLVSFPDISSTAVLVTSIFTVCKSLLTTVFWLLLLYAIVKLIQQRLRRS